MVKVKQIAHLLPKNLLLQNFSKPAKQLGQRDRVKLKQALDEELNAITLTRDQILTALIQPDGKLSKNATRALIKHAANTLAGNEVRKVLAKRERRVAAKWSLIFDAIQNPVFGSTPTKLIDAYAFQRIAHPTCKICQNQTTFFRFGEPYGTYCGAKCQLTDPEFKAKQELASLEKWGVKHPLMLKESQAKAKIGWQNSCKQKAELSEYLTAALIVFIQMNWQRGCARALNTQTTTLSHYAVI